jgi:hypothetical protein
MSQRTEHAHNQKGRQLAVMDLSTKQRAVMMTQRTEHAHNQKNRQLAVKDLSTEAEGSGDDTAH